MAISNACTEPIEFQPTKNFFGINYAVRVEIHEFYRSEPAAALSVERETRVQLSVLRHKTIFASIGNGTMDYEYDNSRIPTYGAQFQKILMLENVWLFLQIPFLLYERYSIHSIPEPMFCMLAVTTKNA